MFWVEKNQSINQRGTSIRHSRVGTKFRLKMTLLNFWIKLTQKGYFRTKKLNSSIEFYISRLIQILNFSCNNFGFLEQIFKNIYFRSKTRKNEHLIAISWTTFSKKGSYFQSITNKIDTTIDLCIFELVFVSNFILNKQF